MRYPSLFFLFFFYLSAECLWSQSTFNQSVICAKVDSFCQKGELPQAWEWLEEKHRALEQAQLTNDPLMVEWLFAQGKYHLENRAYPQAVQAYEAARMRHLRVSPFDTLRLIDILKAYSWALQKNSQASKAFPVMEEIIALSKAAEGEQSETVALAYRSLATLYFRQNKRRLSFEYNLKAKRILEQVAQTHTYDYGAVCYHLGMHHFYTKEYTEALTYYDKSFAILNSLRGRERLAAQCLNDIGEIYQCQGKLDSAVQYQLKAARIYESARDKSHLRYTYKSIAHIYLDNSVAAPNHTMLALSYLQKARAACENPDEDGINLLLSYHSCYTRVGDHVRALAYADSVCHSVATLNAKEGEMLHLKGSLQWMGLHARAISLKNIAEAQQNPALLVEAAHVLDEAHHWLDSLTRFYPSENPKVYDNILTHAGQAIDIYTALFQKTHAATWLYKAFAWSEKSKALHLYQHLAENSDQQKQAIPIDLLEQERDLQRQLETLQRQQVEASEKGMDTRAGQDTIFQTMRQREAVRQAILAYHPSYFKERFIFPDTRLEFLQRTLAPDQGILEYFVTDTAITAFLLLRDTLVVQRLSHPYPAVVAQAVVQFRAAIAAYGRQPEQANELTQQYVRAAHTLYANLVQPFEANMPKRLTIVPHGPLSSFPFEALLMRLPSEQNYYRFHQYQYWGDHCAIAYAPSATILQQVAQRPVSIAGRKSILALAPFYDGTTTWQDSLRTLQRGELSPLPFSGEEVYRIGKLLKGDVLTSQQANRAAFFRVASQYAILHLATHAKANQQNDQFSYLSFQSEPSQGPSERLYAYEASNLALPTELVTLSACETGWGKILAGEGVLSLSRAFLLGGARSVLQSHWLINDASTRQLMILFYENIKDGLPKDVALQKAQRTYRQRFKGEKAHPYYWASFVLLGDARPLYWEKNKER